MIRLKIIRALQYYKDTLIEGNINKLININNRRPKRNTLIKIRNYTLAGLGIMLLVLIDCFIYGFFVAGLAVSSMLTLLFLIN